MAGDSDIRNFQNMIIPFNSQVSSQFEQLSIKFPRRKVDKQKVLLSDGTHVPGKRTMLLETLKALNQAGTEALRSTLGLEVSNREVSLAREGRRSFSSLVALRIKGCPLQLVHVGGDDLLLEKLAQMPPDPGGQKGLDVLAAGFLSHLLEKFDDRHPRGTLEGTQPSPITLHTRGLRTFEFKLDTGQGQLLLLAEVPSRAEMAIAKGSEYLTSMESIYLPGDWRHHDHLVDPEAVAGVLTFLRKTESDIYLEIPVGDGMSTINSGLLVEAGTHEDRPVLKIVTDFTDPSRGVPTNGSMVVASVGVGDRSLGFELVYLAPAAMELDSGIELPCALFTVPSSIEVGQRRRTFRVPLAEMIRVEVESVLGQGEVSPWADPGLPPEVIEGRLADLSFSGARIISEHSRLCSCFQKDGRVRCRLYFSDMEEPLQVMGVIRRSTAGLADRNQWQDEIGIEFLVSPDGDRSAQDYVRQFVLELQRAKLAQRLQVTGS